MKKHLFVLLILGNSLGALSQNLDTLIFQNGHFLVGEIKNLDGGVLTIETDYSEKDILVDWDEVSQINTPTNFVITLSTKQRIYGTLTSDPFNKEYVVIYPLQGSRYYAKLQEIVYLKSDKSTLWDRFSANIDGGYSITKASDNKQFSLNGQVSYLHTSLSSDVYVNFIDNITQDTIRAKRKNYGTNWRFYLPKGMYVLGAADFLTSDEQNLELRSTVQNGVGKFVIQNFKLFWTAALGLALNNEVYKTETPTKTSVESFIESEFNVFNLSDLRLRTKVQVFPSITRFKRFRTNYVLDLKYNLPLDLYAGFNYTYNYDNQASEIGSQHDYVLKSTFGWEF